VATNKNFKIKNGLTVGDVEIVSSTGEWVGPASGLAGPPGPPGDNGLNGLDGMNGVDGMNGLSAYEIAVNNGFVGNELYWLSSLQGADGSDGDDGDNGMNGMDGLSAYQIAVNNGFVGTEAQWIAELVTTTSTHTLTNKTLTSPIVTGVSTFSVGTAAAPAITTTGDSNTGISFPAADTIAFPAGGVERARITTSAMTITGALQVTSSITAMYSDRRLKENIKPITNALDKVDSLTGMLFTQNALAESFGHTDKSQQVGVFAQDIQKVLPEAVKLAPFDMDDNGNSKSGENYLTVQYEKLVPLLIEAIKELRLEINELKGL
jgi:hypothetical protein